ncbi:MAG: hypothetical protein ACKOA9_13525 [Actinomycetota bacterium]
MLWVHEVHRVHGAKEDDFEAAYRDAWMPAVAATGDAKVLYFDHLTHGSGRAYTVVTITAVEDGAAWGNVGRRVQNGDLRDLSRHLDEMRHEVTGKVFTIASWAPVIPGDLASVPADPSLDHEPTLFMEDTAWPFEGKLLDYLAKAEAQYAPSIARSGAAGTAILELQTLLHTAWGSGQRAEVLLWQRIVDQDRLWNLFASELPPPAKAPGTWMHDALVVRDDWRSRLLRTTRWSPLA